MNTVAPDVLSLMIKLLPVRQEFQVQVVNKKFREASILALKKQETICSFDWKFPDDHCLSCFSDEHQAKGYDSIPYKCFKDAIIRKRILSLLPGLKTAFFLYPSNGLQRDLSVYCPQLKCLNFRYSFNGFKRLQNIQQPSLLHLEVSLDAQSVNQLGNVFTSLIGLEANGAGVEAGQMQATSLRSGIKTLVLTNFSGNWKAVLSSPAMKTVEKIRITDDKSPDFPEMDFLAPKLKELDIRFMSFVHTEEPFDFLARSLSYCPEVESFSLYVPVLLGFSLPVNLFHSTPKLRSLSLPQVSNLHQVLQTILSVSPQLKSLTLKGVGEKSVLDVVSQFSRLESLVIDNLSTYIGLLLGIQDINDFLMRNTVDGNLRFECTLYQSAVFPSYNGAKEIDYRGMNWFSHR